MSSRLCVSIGGRTVEDCMAALRGQEFAEVRIDMLEKPDGADMKRIFSGHPRLIAACRPGKIKDEERKMLLLASIDAGAAFVDVEAEAADGWKGEVVAAARARKCQIIVSFHDYKKTPARGELKQMVGWCFESGADIAKIACRANSDGDNARLLGLLDDKRKIIVIGMGPKGRITRVVAPLLGSPFTFVCPGRGRETAAGQMTKRELERIFRLLGAGNGAGAGNR